MSASESLGRGGRGLARESLGVELKHRDVREGLRERRVKNGSSKSLNRAGSMMLAALLA